MAQTTIDDIIQEIIDDLINSHFLSLNIYTPQKNNFCELYICFSRHFKCIKSQVVLAKINDI